MEFRRGLMILVFSAVGTVLALMTIVITFQLDGSIGIASIFALVFIVTGMRMDGKENSKKQAKDKKSLLKVLCEETDEFSPTQYVAISTSGIAIDELNRKIRVVSHFEVHTLDYRDIMSSEIIEDGVTVTSSSRSIAGAVVGGMIAGGVGAIIGVTSGTTTTTHEVRKIVLKITINDTETPVLYVTFLVNDTPIKKSSLLYRENYELAARWHGLVHVLIKRADDELKQTTVHRLSVVSEELASTAAVSTADELLKLAELRDKGVLTQEEFNNEKLKVLLK